MINLMNFKQKELAEQLFADVKAKFPEIEFLGYSAHPENPNQIWIMVSYLNDDEREAARMDFSAIKSTDILEQYGYLITLMPTKRKLMPTSSV
jgi:hypothetical protein